MKDTEYVWAIGIEHETQLFYYPVSNSIKDYEIMKLEGICEYMLKNWLKLKNIYLKQKDSDKLLVKTLFSEKNYNFLQEIVVRKFESTGRKCSGKWVLKPVHDKNNKSVKMPEFVSDSPFKKYSIEKYCEQIIEQQNRFIRIISFHPSLRKKLQNSYPVPFPFGMSNYIRCDNRLFKDYTGSFHVTITLPFTSKTTNKRFIENHKAFANAVQWIEPLLVPGFFSGDDKAIGSKDKRIKGPFRVTCVGWGNFAGSDIRKFEQGIGRLTNHTNNWRDGLTFHDKNKTNYCKKVAKLVQLREPAAMSGFSSDFRTFGGEDHISGYGMAKPNGVELRIFDNIHTSYTSRLCRLLVYIAENSRKHKVSKYVYKDVDWIKTLHNIAEDGWKANVTPNYLKKLRIIFKLKLETDSLRAWDILKVFNEELFRKNKVGLWSKLLLRKIYLKPTSLVCINRLSLECGFMFNLNRNATLRNKLIKLYNSLDNKSTLKKFTIDFFKVLDKKTFKNDVQDIAYLFETLGCITIKLSKGDIKEIIKKKCNINKIVSIQNISNLLRAHFENACGFDSRDSWKSL
jgi:hypothetical protein|tara:strand:- start:418 stop:2124 length:1707 start_codon:yes stop_codon:yes gene_type:complete